MTKEEAIKVLDQVRQWTDYPKEAFTMAIDALSQPSLPSNLDEAVEDFVWEVMENDEDGISNLCQKLRPWSKISDFYGALAEFFKAGAEWMEGQGVSYKGTISADKTIPVLPMKDVSDMGLDYGDRVIVQIRKKD